MSHKGNLSVAKRIDKNIKDSLALIKEIDGFESSWSEAGSLAVYLRTATIASGNLVITLQAWVDKELKEKRK